VAGRSHGLKKLTVEVLAWLFACSEVQVIHKWFAYRAADANATTSSLASLKSRMDFISGASLPRLSWRKRLLNR